MSDFLAGWRFALRRLSAGWRFVAVSALGVLVASTLLAIGPIYSTAMSDLGLAFRLGRELPGVEDRLAYLGVSGLRIGNAEHQAAVEVIDTITAARVDWLGDGVLTESRTDRFDVSFRDHPSPDVPVEVPAGADTVVRQAWGGYLFHLGGPGGPDGWESGVDVVDGRLPGAGPVAEAVLPESYQRHAALGDVLRLTATAMNDCPNVPRSEDPREAAAEVRCQPSLQMRTYVDVTIVGFVRPHDATAERWSLFEGQWEAPDAPILPRLQGASPVDPRRSDVVQGIGQLPLLTTGEQFNEVFRAQMPEATMRHRAGIVADTSRLGLGEVAYAVEDLSQWQRDVRERLELTGFGRMDLLATLQGFQTSQSFTAAPLLIMLLQVVGIVVYYVVMVMTMLLERQRQEAGVFRSRGATTSQLVGFNFVEGMAFVIPALLVAPWLAAGIVSLLGYTPTFEVITGGDRLPVNVSPEAYLLAVVGGLVSLVAILVPAYLSVRRGIVDVKREESRPAERNFLQRYFLDFALVGLAMLLMWQLNRQGSVYDPNAVGGWGSDPLLLAAPFALTASVALMILRFYPPLIRLAVRLLLLLRGTAAAIGLRRAGRAPASYARVTLLIIMAIAVGTFAASYGPTVDQSLEDRARYTAAVDLRGRLVNPADREMAAQLEALEAIDGVADVARAYRGAIATTGGLGTALLGVDPEAVVDGVWWRDDFATQPVEALMGQLGADVSLVGGYPLPEDVQHLQVQVNTTNVDRFAIRARFRQEDGRYIEAYLRSETASDGEWSTWSGEVPSFGGPVSFGGLMMDDNRAGGVLRDEGYTLLDDLVAVRADGTVVELDAFEGPQRWIMLNTADSREEFVLTTEDAVSGEQSLRWNWGQLTQPRTRAFAPAMPALPLPAVMDEGALGAFRIAAGGLSFADLGGIAVPVHARAQTELFPSMDPAAGIVVVNMEHLREVASFLGFTPYGAPNELWVRFDEGVSVAAQQSLALALVEGTDTAVPTIEREWFAQALDVEGANADPTLQAAGSGILAVAFISVIGLCTVGFVATLALGARQRATEFAVLRAVGVSRGEVLRALLLEWGVVLFVGVAVGALLGRQVAEVMLGFLNVTEAGAAVVPPFVLQTSWPMLGAGLAVLVGAVAASLLVAWLSAMRRSPTVELRLTQ